MKVADKVDLIRIHRSTHGLSEEEISTLADEATTEVFAPGDIIQHALAPLDSLRLIARGSIRLSLRVNEHVEKTLMYLGRDDQLGLFALTQESPTPLSAVAEEPTVVLRFPREAVEQLLVDIPRWRHNLLQSLGPAIRQSCLGIKRRRRLRSVAMIHSSERTRDLVTDVVARLVKLGETIGLISDHRDTLACDCEHNFLLDRDGTATATQIRENISNWHTDDRVVLDAGQPSIATFCAELLSAVESVYWFVTPDLIDQVAETLAPLCEEIPGLANKVRIVHVLRRDEQVAPRTSVLDGLCCDDFKVHPEGVQSGAFLCSRHAGLERVVHQLRGSTIGLALGGGAARGMAHLGVLEVLEEAGIVVDRISGTSAGSLVGVNYAAGYSVEFLTESFSRDLTPGWLFRRMPYGDGIYLLWKFRSGGWEPMLRKYLEDWRLEQFPVPFSAVSVDLVSAEQIVRRKFDAVKSILESINLPGISRPICYDGRALIDGGVLNVVPADVLVGQDADFVISSDVASKIELEFAGNRPGTPTDQMKRPSASAGLVRTRVVQDRNIRSMGGAAADIVIEPDVSRVELTDFKRAREIAKIGRDAAIEALPRLRQTLHDLDPQLYPTS